MVLLLVNGGKAGVSVCSFQLIKDTALRAQVLAVVFIHFISSGILALEANVVLTNGNAQSSLPELSSWCTTARSTVTGALYHKCCGWIMVVA